MALRLGQPVCQGKSPAGRRSSNRVRNRNAHRGKGLPRVKKNSFLLLEFKEKVEEVHGDQGHPLEQGNHSPGASDFVLRVLHSASSILVSINKSSTNNIWVFVASFLGQKLHNSKGSLLLLVSSSGLEVWPFSRPLLMLKAPTTFLAPAGGKGSRK